MGAGAMGRSRHIPSAAVGITAAIGQLAGDLIHELLARVSTLNFIISELTIVDRFLHRLARVGNSSALCKARGGKRFAPLGPATRGQVLHIHRHLGRSALRGVRLGLVRAANALSEDVPGSQPMARTRYRAPVGRPIPRHTCTAAVQQETARWGRLVADW